MDLQAFRRDLGDIPVEDNPKLVQLKSRDFYWYSPVLKRKLGHVTADLVVSPRSTDEVVTTLASAHRHGVPITPTRRRHRQLWPVDAADRGALC